MKKIILTTLILLALLVLPVYAEMGESLSMIGEGLIGLPGSVFKVVGGTLKLGGEIILFPFQLMS